MWDIDTAPEVRRDPECDPGARAEKNPRAVSIIKGGEKNYRAKPGGGI
jgi:hypothetical protein